MAEPDEQDLPEQKPDQDMQDDQGAAEYIFDDQAEQIQGRLAADNVQNEDDKDDGKEEVKDQAADADAEDMPMEE